MSQTTVPFRNRLLQALPAEDVEALTAAAEWVQLELRQVLARPHEPLEHVYFPADAVASVVALTRRRRIEVAIYGRDGMSGPSLALGVDRTPHEHFIQIAGQAHRIATADFVRLIDQRPRLRALLLRYAQAFAVQTAQTGLANGAYTIQERLARWLLMCDDRVDGPELPLTHDFLALMLGVRRSSVTVALHALEAAGLIRAARGRVSLLDRARLVTAAGESYGIAEAEYDRLIAPPG